MVISLSSSSTSVPSKVKAAATGYSDSSNATNNNKLKTMAKKQDAKIQEQEQGSKRRLQMKFAWPSNSDHRLRRSSGIHYTQQRPVIGARSDSGITLTPTQIGPRPPQHHHRRMRRRNSVVIPRSAAHGFFASLDSTDEVKEEQERVPTKACESLTKASVTEPVVESQSSRTPVHSSYVVLPPEESSSSLRATISSSSLLSFCTCPFEEEDERQVVDFGNAHEDIGADDRRALH